MRQEPARESESERLNARPEQQSAGKREVDLYVRTYNTLLRSSGPIAVATRPEAPASSARRPRRSALKDADTRATPMSLRLRSQLPAHGVGPVCPAR